MTRSRWVAAAAVALALACKLEPGGRCTGDGDCQAGLRCGADGLCVVDTGKDLGASCAIDQDCVSWGTCQGNVCVLAAGACVANGDCAAWQTCTAHVCQRDPTECAWDSDCPGSWQVCRSQVCVSAPGRCDPATVKKDCATWQTCDAQNVCVTAAGKCAADADCGPFQTCAASHACASAVLLWGNLGAAGTDAVSQLATPAIPFVGFGSASVDARIDPSGNLVYRDGTTTQSLRTFVPGTSADALVWDATTARWLYPAAPFDNDVVVDTPNCSAGTIDRWTMTGAGKVLHSCTAGLWYDATGAEAFAEPTGYDLVAWSASDAKLLEVEGGTGFLVEDKAGVELTVSLTGARAYVTSVASVNGNDFWLALFDAAGAGELWSVTGTGVATLIAAYPPTPVLTEPDPDLRSSPLVQTGPVVLDAAGVAYVVMSPSITPSKVWKAGTKVVKRVAGATTSTVVYDAGTKPTGANAWTSQATPLWWALPSASGPLLVTGP